MFTKKPEEPKLVGAIEKIAAAERMRNAARDDAEKAYGPSKGGQTVPATIIFVLSVVFAFMTVDSNPAGVGLHLTGVMSVDKTLFGPGIQPFTGSAETDMAIVALIRGFALFLLAGLPPLFASLASGMFGRGRISPFVASWGALIVLPMIIYPLREVLGSLAGDLLRAF